MGRKFAHFRKRMHKIEERERLLNDRDYVLALQLRRAGSAICVQRWFRNRQKRGGKDGKDFSIRIFMTVCRRSPLAFEGMRFIGHDMALRIQMLHRRHAARRILRIKRHEKWELENEALRIKAAIAIQNVFRCHRARTRIRNLKEYILEEQRKRQQRKSEALQPELFQLALPDTLARGANLLGLSDMLEETVEEDEEDDGNDETLGTGSTSTVGLLQRSHSDHLGISTRAKKKKKAKRFSLSINLSQMKRATGTLIARINPLQTLIEKRAALKMQSAWRRRVAAKELKAKKKHKAWLWKNRKPINATKIQKIIRAKLARTKVMERRKQNSACKIQSLWRGQRDRTMLKFIEKFRPAALLIQRHWRAKIGRAAVRIVRERRAALFGTVQPMQKVVRGHLARQRVEVVRRKRRISAEIG